MASLATAVSIRNYSPKGNSDNSMAVFIGDLGIYFSYTTPIAFGTARVRCVSRENGWGPTTGKHLAWAEGDDPAAKSRRLPSAEFEAALTAAISKGGAS